MRLFVAVWPDEATRRAIRTLAIERAEGLRPVRPEQWHVTLRFFGEVAPALVPALADALRSAASAEPPIRAQVGPATGWFGRGAVLQLPVEGLGRLAARVRTATSSVVPLPDRDEPPFTGHLTLARGDRRRRPARESRARLAGMAVTAEFPVDELDLVVSEPTPAGHRYHSLERFPLGGTVARS